MKMNSSSIIQGGRGKFLYPLQKGRSVIVVVTLQLRYSDCFLYCDDDPVCSIYENRSQLWCQCEEIYMYPCNLHLVIQLCISAQSVCWLRRASNLPVVDVITVHVAHISWCDCINLLVGHCCRSTSPSTSVVLRIFSPQAPSGWLSSLLFSLSLSLSLVSRD